MKTVSSLLLAAPPWRVYRALIDPAELVRWYSKAAELHVRVGGLGQFEGKDGHFLESWRVEHLNPPGRLSVAWRNEADWYQGVQVQVDLVLEAAAGGCRLEATLTAPEGSPLGFEAASAEWELALTRLAQQLGAEAAALEALQSIRTEVEVPLTPAAVWSALTEADCYWSEAEVPLRVGAVARFRVPGQSEPDLAVVRAVEPGVLLALEWQSGGYRTAVRWELMATETGCRWTVTDGPYRGTDRWRRAVCEVGWRSVQAALQAWASAGPTKWDKAAWLASQDYRQRLVCPASLEQVWAGWTLPDRMTWLGGHGHWTFEPFPTLLWEGPDERRLHSLQVTPGQRLLFRSRVGERLSIVSVRFEPDEGGTVLHLHHWGTASPEDGWADRLQALLASLSACGPLVPQPTLSCEAPSIS